MCYMLYCISDSIVDCGLVRSVSDNCFIVVCEGGGEEGASYAEHEHCFIYNN